jgi:hypothetical protein
VGEVTDGASHYLDRILNRERRTGSFKGSTAEQYQVKKTLLFYHPKRKDANHLTQTSSTMNQRKPSKETLDKWHKDPNNWIRPFLL